MGAVKSIPESVNGLGNEPTFSADGQWGGSMGRLFEDEAIIPSSDGGDKGDGVDVVDNREADDSSNDLADSTLVLAGDLLPDPRHAVVLMEGRLSHQLRNLSCPHLAHDPFAALMSKRHSLLLRMHNTMSTTSASAVANRARSKSGILKGQKPKTHGNSMGHPSALRLALQLLYSMLDFVRDDASCEARQRADFLSEVAPILSNLPPLCLADSGHYTPGTTVSTEDDDVLDSLRDFLYLASIPGAYFTHDAPPRHHRGQERRRRRLRRQDATSSKVSNKSFIAEDVGSAARSEMDAAVDLGSASMVEQRTAAAAALLGLASARGRASDLLIAVKVLLGVGLPSPLPPKKTSPQHGRGSQLASGSTRAMTTTTTSHAPPEEEEQQKQQQQLRPTGGPQEEGGVREGQQQRQKDGRSWVPLPVEPTLAKGKHEASKLVKRPQLSKVQRKMANPALPDTPAADSEDACDEGAEMGAWTDDKVEGCGEPNDDDGGPESSATTTAPSPLQSPQQKSPVLLSSSALLLDMDHDLDGDDGMMVLDGGASKNKNNHGSNCATSNKLSKVDNHRRAGSSSKLTDSHHRQQQQQQQQPPHLLLGGSASPPPESSTSSLPSSSNLDKLLDHSSTTTNLSKQALLPEAAGGSQVEFQWGRNPKAMAKLSSKQANKQQQQQPIPPSGVVGPRPVATKGDLPSKNFQKVPPPVSSSSSARGGDDDSSVDRRHDYEYQEEDEQRATGSSSNTAILSALKSPAVLRILKQLQGCAPTTGNPSLSSSSSSSFLESSSSSQPFSEAATAAGEAAGSMGGEEAAGESEVWTCGQNSYGELAHEDTATKKTHTRVEGLRGKHVRWVAAGNEHTVVLLQDGQVLSVGYNDNGQCGQGHTTRVNQLTCVDRLVGKGTKEVHAFNGCEHTLAVLRDGRLAAFGYNYRGQLGHGGTSPESIPKLVRGLEGRKVRLVSCSYYHTVIACSDDSGDSGGGGGVYSFGRNDFGQLGHGDTSDRKVPRLIESVRGQRATSLACGQYHTCVTTSSGQVLSCGKNDYGQLGLEAAESQRLLVPVNLGSALNGSSSAVTSSPSPPTTEATQTSPPFVLQVRCGYYHTIALCRGGRVYGWGRNDYGQLGLGHAAQRVFGAHLIGGVEGGVRKLAAGCYHSVIVGRDGTLFVFGRNNHGQLGTGDTEEQHSPKPIALFRGKRVRMVAAGFYHTIVLTGRRKSNSGPVDDDDDDDDCDGYGSQSRHAAAVAAAKAKAVSTPFSPEFMLSLPNLQLTNESGKDGEVSVTTGETAATADKATRTPCLSPPSTTSDLTLSKQPEAETTVLFPEDQDEDKEEGKEDGGDGKVDGDVNEGQLPGENQPQQGDDDDDDDDHSSPHPPLRGQLLSSAQRRRMRQQQQEQQQQHEQHQQQPRSTVGGSTSLSSSAASLPSDPTQNVSSVVSPAATAKTPAGEVAAAGACQKEEGLAMALRDAAKMDVSAQGGVVDAATGAAPPELAALFILAHMDRLSTTNSPSSASSFKQSGESSADDLSPLAASKPKNRSSGPKAESTYAVDVCCETFESLLALLMSLHQQQQSSCSDDGDDKSVCSREVYCPFMILALLRILKANLTAFLSSSATALSAAVLKSLVSHAASKQRHNRWRQQQQGPFPSSPTTVRRKRPLQKQQLNSSGKLEESFEEHAADTKQDQQQEQQHSKCVRKGRSSSFLNLDGEASSNSGWGRRDDEWHIDRCQERRRVLFELPPVLGRGRRGAGRDEKREQVDEIARFREVMEGLQEQLITLVVNPLPLHFDSHPQKEQQPHREQQQQQQQEQDLGDSKQDEEVEGNDDEQNEPFTAQEKAREEKKKKAPLNDSSNAGAKSMIQAQAAELLILGVELFYPTPADQTGLLEELLTPPTTTSSFPNQPKKMNGGLDYDANDWVVQQKKQVAHDRWISARKFLLKPLLRRLSNDVLTAKLVNSTTQQQQPAKKMKKKSPPQSEVLPTTLRLLVTHIVASGSALDAVDKETRVLLTELLLTVQKHATSWAGRNLSTTSNKTCVGSMDDGKEDAVGEAAVLLQGGFKDEGDNDDDDAHRVGDGDASCKIDDECLVVQPKEPLAVAFETKTPSPSPSPILEHALRKLRIGLATAAKNSEQQQQKQSTKKRPSMAVALPAGWQCMLDYSTLVLRQSVGILAGDPSSWTLTPLAASTVAAAAAAAAAAAPLSPSEQLLPGLRSSLVGTVLPSLLSTLLAFSHEPLFAQRLLPLLTRTAHLLYKALRTHDPSGSLAAADEAYVCLRAGEPATPSALSGLLGVNGVAAAAAAAKTGVGAATASSSVHFRHRSSSSATATEDAGACGSSAGVGNSSSSSSSEVPPRLPWVLSLLKCSAVLAGQLAGTLVLGRGHCHRSVTSITAQARPWLRTGLLKRGLTAPNLHLLEHHRMAPSPNHSTSQPHHPLPWPFAATAAAGIAGIAAAATGVATPQGDCVSPLSMAAALVVPLRAAYAKVDFGYHILCRQAMRPVPHSPAAAARKAAAAAAASREEGGVGSSEVGAVADFGSVEVAVLAALLHHEGLTPTAALFVRAHNQKMQQQQQQQQQQGQPQQKQSSSPLSVPLPRRLLAVFRVVSELSTWLWRRRSALRAQGQVDDGVDASSSLLSHAEAAAKCLLVFAPSDPPHCPLSHVPSPPPPPPPLHSPSSGSAAVGRNSSSSGSSVAARRWRIALCRIRAVVRWRDAYGRRSKGSSSSQAVGGVAMVQRPRSAVVLRPKSAGQRVMSTGGHGLGRVLESVTADSRALLDLLRTLINASVASSSSSSSSSSSTDQTSPVQSLTLLVVERHRRARARTQGMQAFHDLAGTCLLSGSSLLLDVLSPLAPALRSAGEEEDEALANEAAMTGAGGKRRNISSEAQCHYLVGLEGVEGAARSAVRSSHSSLFSDLLRAMDATVKTPSVTTPAPAPLAAITAGGKSGAGGGGRGGRGGRGLSSSAASLGATANTTNTKMTTGQDSGALVDCHNFLLLCDAWSLPLDSLDWSFLAASGVLNTLHRIVVRLETAHALAATTNAASNSAGNTSAAGGSSSDARGGASRRRSSASSSSSAAASAGGTALVALLAGRSKRLQVCVAAARSLWRLLVARLANVGGNQQHLGSSSQTQSPSSSVSFEPASRVAWSAVLSPCFDVLLLDLKRSLEVMRPASQAVFSGGQSTSAAAAGSSSGGGASSSQDGRSSNGSSSSSSADRPGHRRRCQEIITTPRRFMSMEDGLSVSAEQLLANSKGPDFSICFWIYLTQPESGGNGGKSRAILTRGQRHERWPVLLLRDGDRRLEVSFGLSSMETLREVLVSKEPLPLHKWTHVGLVSEANKLRLYFNGSLDSPRNNVGVPSFHRAASRHPLYVGKVPDGHVRLDGVRGGFEGSMAHLKFYTRALSPIHVRIVCDQGAPETEAVRDRRCFQACASLTLIATSSALGRRHLSSPAWIEALLTTVVQAASSRVQQSALRLLALVLPAATPSQIRLRCTPALGTPETKAAGVVVAVANSESAATSTEPQQAVSTAATSSSSSSSEASVPVLALSGVANSLAPIGDAGVFTVCTPRGSPLLAPLTPRRSSSSSNAEAVAEATSAAKKAATLDMPLELSPPKATTTTPALNTFPLLLIDTEAAAKMERSISFPTYLLHILGRALWRTQLHQEQQQQQQQQPQQDEASLVPPHALPLNLSLACSGHQRDSSSSSSSGELDGGGPNRQQGQQQQQQYDEDGLPVHSFDAAAAAADGSGGGGGGVGGNGADCLSPEAVSEVGLLAGEVSSLLQSMLRSQTWACVTSDALSEALASMTASLRQHYDQPCLLSSPLIRANSSSSIPAHDRTTDQDKEEDEVKTGAVEPLPVEPSSPSSSPALSSLSPTPPSSPDASSSSSSLCGLAALCVLGGHDAAEMPRPGGFVTVGGGVGGLGAGGGGGHADFPGVVVSLDETAGIAHVVMPPSISAKDQVPASFSPAAKALAAQVGSNKSSPNEETGPASPFIPSSTTPAKSLKALRVSTDELAVVPTPKHTLDGGGRSSQEEVAASEAAVAELVASAVFPLAEALLDMGLSQPLSETLAAAAALTTQKSEEKNRGGGGRRNIAGGARSSSSNPWQVPGLNSPATSSLLGGRWEPRSLFHAQCQARVAKVLDTDAFLHLWTTTNNLSHPSSPSVSSSLATVIASAKPHSGNSSSSSSSSSTNLKQRNRLEGLVLLLASLAVQVDDSLEGGRFSTLAEAEQRVAAARRRLLQVYAHPLEDPVGLLAAAEDEAMMREAAMEHAREQEEEEAEAEGKEMLDQDESCSDEVAQLLEDEVNGARAFRHRLELLQASGASGGGHHHLLHQQQQHQSQQHQLHREHGQDNEGDGDDDDAVRGLAMEMANMGFPESWCLIALRETGNDVVSARTWIVDNLNLLDPSALGSGSESGGGAPADVVSAAEAAASAASLHRREQLMEQERSAEEQYRMLSVSADIQRRAAAAGEQKEEHEEDDENEEELHSAAGTEEEDDGVEREEEEAAREIEAEEEAEEEMHRRLDENSESEADDDDEGELDGDDSSGVERLLERINNQEAREMRRRRQRQQQLADEQRRGGEGASGDTEVGEMDEDENDDEARLEAMLLMHGASQNMHAGGGVSGEGGGGVGGGLADRFEEEQASQGYGECFFPADPVMLPGPSLHGAAGFAYAPLSTLSLPPGFDPATMAHQPGSGSFLQQQHAAAAAMLLGSGGNGGGLHAGLCPRPLKAVCAEVAGMDVGQLHEALLAAEATLAVLHARAAIVKLFNSALTAAHANESEARHQQLRLTHQHQHRYTKTSPSTVPCGGGVEVLALLKGDGVLAPEVVVQLVRLLCLRGVQLPLETLQGHHAPPARDIVVHSLPLPPTHSTGPTLPPPLPPPPLPLSLVPCTIAAAPLTTTSVMRTALAHMLRSDNSDSRAGVGLLAESLLNAALDDLEAAALIDVFGDTPWFSRSLCASDSQATLQPSVELAWWILDLLLAPLYPPATPSPSSSSSSAAPIVLGPHPCIVSGAVLFRLGHCLRSGNMPVKEVAMRATTRIAVHWCDRLEAAPLEDCAASASVLG